MSKTDYRKILVESSSGQVYEGILVKQFIKEYHPTLSAPAIDKAIKSGKVDAIQPARDIFVILSPNTLSYTPNKYKDKRYI